VTLCKRTLRSRAQLAGLPLLGDSMSVSTASLALPYFEKAVEIQPKINRTPEPRRVLIEVKHSPGPQVMLQEILSAYPSPRSAVQSRRAVTKSCTGPRGARGVSWPKWRIIPTASRRLNLARCWPRWATGRLDDEMREVMRIAPKRRKATCSSAGALLRVATLDEVQSLAEQADPCRHLRSSRPRMFVMADVFNRSTSRTG